MPVGVEDAPPPPPSEREVPIRIRRIGMRCLCTFICWLSTYSSTQGPLLCCSPALWFERVLQPFQCGMQTSCFGRQNMAKDNGQT